MARVRLSRYQAEEGRMPAVCMRCGRPADLTRSRTFSWHPPWIDWFLVLGLILFWPLLIVGIVLAAVQTKRMYVAVPLCQAHRNHWLWRAWFIYGGLAAVVALGVGAFTFLIAVPQGDQATQTVAGWVCAGTGLVGFVWLIAAAFVQKGAISPAEITDRDISLSRVSPSFKEAVERERDQEDGFGEEEPPARFRRRPEESEGVYDPDAQKRRPLPPDTYRQGEA
jgi:hypothetical protein